MEKFFKHPWVIVGIIAAITVFFAAQLPKVELDNNNYRFIPEDDEARVTSDYIDDAFGSSLFVLVGLEPENTTVLDPDFLKTLRAYIDRIEAISLVGDINSIVNADYITSNGDSIVVEDIVSADFSGSPAEVAALKQRLLSWDLYRNALVSDDFSATQILVPLDIKTEDSGKPEIVAEYMQIRDIALEMFGGSAEVYVTGLPVIAATLSESMRTDLAVLVPIVIIVVLITLFLSFRRVTGVVLPLLTVLVATIWTIGAMPLFGFKMTILTTVLPVILIAVGTAYGIHLVTHYLDENTASKKLNREEHTELVFSVVRRMRKPVFLAALTTFAGFFSFCFTRVVPIYEMGIFACFGVAISFLVALTLIPSLLIIRGPKPMKVYQSGKIPSNDSWDSSLPDLLIAVSRKKRFSLACAALLAIVSLAGASKLVIDNAFVEYFSPESGISRSDRFIREKFGGSKVVNVVMESDNFENLLHPDSLTAMDNLGLYLEKNIAETGKTMSFSDLIKRINQVFNADESPSGLLTAGLLSAGLASVTADSADAGFGFGFDEADSGEAGFGFGFDDGADNGGGAFTADGMAANSASENGNRLEETYTAGQRLNTVELMALFDRAVSEGGRTMNAGEFTDALKKMVNYEGASYYEIPADPARYGKTSPEELGRIVSNYLVLLSGSIDSYANDPLEPTAIKMVVQMRTLGEQDTGRVIAAIRRFIDTNFPKKVKTIIGGAAMVESSLNRLVVESQLVSVVIALATVFVIIAFSNRSPAAGLIGIIPLVITILVNFGIMGFRGIKLNIATSLIASLSIGIGIDYTIHFLDTFKTEFKRTGGGDDFLRRTFATAGKAIIINAVSVGLGFAVMLFSQFIVLRDMGVLIALTMFVSAFISLTLLPVLLTTIKPKFIYGQGN